MDGYAFIEGYNACSAGLPLWSNPHAIGCEAYMSWVQGFSRSAEDRKHRRHDPIAA